MSEIDIQNAKQIRDPMDVLITMSLADDDIDMTYSGYSTAKVADGVLDQSSWPMRKLADLQGDGFPLDGSCVLYNASTTPSQANGKLGVRSNVGEAVSVTATGDRTMASIGASVTGAESVTMNGTTTPITGTNVTLPLLDTTATLTFNPASETRRIEINTVLPEADFKITNENLIRATVSLRSDLSISDPTLPESEINIEAYFDEDVSEAVAAIPEDTPIKYQAGYPGDMSQERKFYVTGQVTWADNVLSIQGVDAVHFLDVPIGPLGFWAFNPLDQLTPSYDLIQTMCVSAARLGVDTYPEIVYFGMPKFKAGSKTHTTTVVPRGVTLRELLAFSSNVFKIEHIPKGYYNDRYIDDELSFWVGYVDAGIPALYSTKQKPKWAISENDCADLKKKIDKAIASIQVEYSTAEVFNDNYPLYDGAVEHGTVDWNETGVAFVNINDMIGSLMIGLTPADIPSVEPYSDNRTVIPILPTDTDGSISSFPDFSVVRYRYKNLRFDGTWSENQSATSRGGYPIIDSETPQDLKTDYGYTIFTQTIPATAKFDSDSDWRWRSISAAWQGLKRAGYIGAGDKTTTLKVFGGGINSETTTRRYVKSGASTGDAITLDSKLMGWMGIRNSTTNEEMEIFPDGAFNSLFNRSNITGSFTWKGDPRMQPRDVVEWERLDGTTTTITLENITLTHEGGGTMAEITYREGVV